AAASLDLTVEFCDAKHAFKAHQVLTKLNWYLRGHRPTRLHEFSRQLVRICLELGARSLLTTGIAPVDVDALQAIGRAGLLRLNFLTDDPFNSCHHAPWFLRALRHYDFVF